MRTAPVHFPLIRTVRYRAQPGNRSVGGDLSEFPGCIGGWKRRPRLTGIVAQALRKGEHSGLTNRGPARKGWHG
jgi:hypothetical protein